METIVITLLILSFVIINNYFQSKNEKERFREFVRSTKTENIQQYEEAIFEDKNEPEEVKDELVDLTEIEPEQLLEKLKDESH